MESSPIFTNLEATLFLKTHWKKLQDEGINLEKLLKNQERNASMQINFENFSFDFSHQNLDMDALHLLQILINQSHIVSRIKQMKNGVNEIKESRKK